MRPLWLPEEDEMRLLPGSMRGRNSTRPAGRDRTRVAPLLAALLLSLLALAAIGLAGSAPASAAGKTKAPVAASTASPTPEPTEAPSPTATPFTQGRHVYDYGDVLSTRSASTAEALAAHIEAAGGGRVVVYTVPQSGDVPSTLATDWAVDGLLLTTEGSFGDETLGSTLSGRLTSEQKKFLDSYSSPSMATSESWLLSTLARVDALVSGTHVFDGTGLLDANGKQQAEAAAKDLGSKIGGTVYIDIALGGDNPKHTAFFNGASMTSHLGKSLVIALGVSGTEIGGYIYADSALWGTYTTNSPWSSDSIDSQQAAGGDVQAAILSDIKAVQKPPLISSDAIPWIIFVVVVVIFSITAPFLWGPWLIGKLAGATGPIKGGLPGDAVIESIADTGVTVTMPSVGPDAPDYKLGLQVTPSYGSSAPYHVDTKVLVPRIYIPMIVPGAQIGVLIDPKDPQKVSVDFSRIGGSAAAVGAGGAGGSGAGGSGAGGMDFSFDANGQPSAGSVSSLIGAVRSGALPTIKGSAAQLLATGTHGTAVITTCQPMGKTVRDMNPAAEASHLNDPMWLFTLEVSLAGQNPFPAVFGHRVPVDKVALIAPGVKLAVAVDESNKNQDVAIDWDKSPLAN
jgi:uncharacterized membrane protein YgcG